MAHYYGVMVGMDNVMTELGISWDIHVSPIHDQFPILFPLIQPECACSELSECLNHCIIIVHTSLNVFYQPITSAAYEGGLHVPYFEHVRGE